jgi:flagellar motor switch protein FliM
LLESQEPSVQFASIAGPAEMCIAARCEFTVSNRPPCAALLCLPSTMTRMIVDGLRNKASGGETRPGVVAEAARKRIMEVPLDLVFQFPSFVTTPAELLTLQVGDSLGLGHPKGRPLEVRAEGKLVALAEICSSGVHKACEIVEEVTR